MKDPTQHMVKTETKIALAYSGASKLNTLTYSIIKNYSAKVKQIKSGPHKSPYQ